MMPPSFLRIASVAERGRRAKSGLRQQARVVGLALHGDGHAMRDRARGRVRLGFGCGVVDDLQRSGRPGRGLLPHVGELVREQLPARGGARVVAARAEYHVGPNRVCQSTDGSH